MGDSPIEKMKVNPTLAEWRSFVPSLFFNNIALTTFNNLYGCWFLLGVCACFRLTLPCTGAVSQAMISVCGVALSACALWHCAG